MKKKSKIFISTLAIGLISLVPIFFVSTRSEVISYSKKMESKRVDGIDKFDMSINGNLTQIGQEELLNSNTITYEFDYSEDKYWFYDQPNFIKPIWRETKSEIPDYWIRLPSGKWYFSGEPEYDDEGNEIIPDPPPSNGYFYQPKGIENTIDKSKWVMEANGKKYKLDKEYDGWKWEFNNNGIFHYYEPPEYGYGWDTGFWPTAIMNEEYHDQNKKVWIEYELLSEDKVIDSGELDISREIDYEKLPIPPSPPIPSIPNYDPLDSREPKWDSSKLDGTQYDLSPDNGIEFWGKGNTSVTFDSDLIWPGYNYEFIARKKYIDSNGNEREFDKEKHEFYTKKSKPFTIMEVIELNDSHNSQGARIEIIDEFNTRVSDIKWKLLEKRNNNVIDSGRFNSDRINLVFDNLDISNEYILELEYSYKLSTNNNEKIQIANDKINFNTNSKKIWDNEIEQSIDWIAYNNCIIINLSLYSDYYQLIDENHLKNAQVIFNTKDMNNNDVQPIDLLSSDIDIDFGSTQLIIDNVFNNGAVEMEFLIESDIFKKNTLSVINSQNNNSGIDINVIPQLITEEIKSDEISINYQIYNNNNNYQIDYLEFRYRNEDNKHSEWSNWEPLPIPQNGAKNTFKIQNLSSDSNYKIETQATYHHNSETIKSKVKSMDFFVKTKKSPYINFDNELFEYDKYLFTTSAWFTFDIFNINEIDYKYIEWSIKNLNTNEYEKTGKKELITNGEISISESDLSINTEYVFSYKYMINDKWYSESIKFKTNNKYMSNNDAYIYKSNSSKINEDSFTLSKKGEIRTLEIYDQSKGIFIKIMNDEFQNNGDKIIIDNILNYLPEKLIFRVNGNIKSEISTHSLDTLVNANIHSLIWVAYLILGIFAVASTTMIGFSWWQIKKSKVKKDNRREEEGIWYSAKDSIKNKNKKKE